MRIVRPCSLLLLAAAACDGLSAPELGEPSVARFWPGSPANGRLVARANGLELAVDRTPTVRATPQGFELVFEGSANRDLDRVFSFVPDDAFAEATLTSPRRFEVAVASGSTLNTLLASTPLLLDVDTVAGRPADLTAWLRLAPRTVWTSTTPDVWVSETASASVRDPAASVRYAIELRAQRPFRVVTGPPGTVVTTTSPQSWRVDLRYEAFVAAAQPGGALAISFDGVEAVTIRTAVALSDLALADNDPYNAWPTCSAAVEACVLATPGFQLGDCGSWFDVQRCYEAQDCAAQPPSPDLLLATRLDGLDAFADDWNQAAVNVGVWGSVAAPESYDVAACPAAAPDLAAVVAAVTANDPRWSTYDFAWGTVTDRAGAAGLPAFSTSYSTEGPALLAAIDRYNAGSDALVWHGEDEVPCPNCHEWDDLTVVWYPAVQRVVVVRGVHGWDS